MEIYCSNQTPDIKYQQWFAVFRSQLTSLKFQSFAFGGRIFNERYHRYIWARKSERVVIYLKKKLFQKIARAHGFCKALGSELMYLCKFECQC
jgi:hypothetical protein